MSLAAPRSRDSGLPPFMAVKSCGFSLSSSLMREKLILDELTDCPEIITCFGESVSCENNEKLYNLLLEYASGGSLADKLKKSDGRRLQESEVRRYSKALLKGLLYIHKLGYVHCNIKLLSAENDAVLKIADFGLANRAGPREGVNSGFDLRGTPLYMSPGMVSGRDQGPPADVWAAGCVVVELLTGGPAWRCSDVAGLLMRIGSGGELPDIPHELSEEGKDFPGKIFVKDQRERWTAEMLLNSLCCCQDFDDVAASMFTASTSPRGPLDLPEWVSCSITSLPSPQYSPEYGCWCSGSESAPAERDLEMKECADQKQRLLSSTVTQQNYEDEDDDDEAISLRNLPFQ